MGWSWLHDEDKIMHPAQMRGWSRANAIIKVSEANQIGRSERPESLPVVHPSGRVLGLEV